MICHPRLKNERTLGYIPKIRAQIEKDPRLYEQGEWFGKGNEEQTVDVMKMLANFAQICSLIVRKETIETESR